LGFLGSLKITTIVKGLVAIAAGIAVLALAGTYGFTGLFMLGTALEPLAVAMLIGAGATFLFAKALEVMGGAGAKGVGVMIAAITAFILMLPKWVITLVSGLLDIVQQIAKILPGIITALGDIISQIIAFVIKEAPKLAVAIGVLVDQIAIVMVNNVPKLIESGAKMIVGILTGISNHIGEIVSKGADIAIKFMNALASKAPDLVNSGAHLINQFLIGIGKKAEGLAGHAANIVLKFISGIAMKIPDLFTIGSKVLAKFIEGIGSHVARLVTAGGRAVLHILTGIGNQIQPLKDKALWLARKFINNFVDGIVGLADRVASGIIRLMNHLAKVIRTREGEFWDAAANLGHAIGDGLKDGIMRAMPGGLKSAIGGAHKVIKGVKGVFKSHSPSQVFMDIGSDLMLGMAIGIDRGHANAAQSADKSATGIVDTMHKTMSNVPGILDGIMDVDPTIRPVLDLSHVKKEAQQIGNIAKMNPFTASVSQGQASAISHEKSQVDQAQAEQIAAAAKPSVEFKQYNNSPEALPAAEIYRRTNNAISQVRKQVGVLSE
jgi:hypothetical protein